VIKPADEKRAIAMKWLRNDRDFVLTEDFFAPNNGVQCPQTGIVEGNDGIRYTLLNEGLFISIGSL